MDISCLVKKCGENLTEGWNGKSGAVIGIVTADGELVNTFGNVSEDSIFETCSLSKVLTAVLAACFAIQGKLRMSDQINPMLPMLKQGITWAELASHRSGLPDYPDNYNYTEHNQFWNCSMDSLRDYISKCRFRFTPGSGYLYSNLGICLLGDLLSKKLKRSYEDLFMAQVVKPLNLPDTGITLTGEKYNRLLPGHSKNGALMGQWDPPLFVACAGGIRSSVKDLLRLSQVALGLVPSPLTTAFNYTHQVRYPVKSSNMPIDFTGLGWRISLRHQNKEFIWHDGSAGGFSTFWGLSLKSQIGIVILSNKMSAPGKNITTLPGFALLLRLCTI